jgi:hypothetical protein
MVLSGSFGLKNFAAKRALLYGFLCDLIRHIFMCDSSTRAFKKYREKILLPPHGISYKRAPFAAKFLISHPSV